MMSHKMFVKTSEIACLMKEANHYPETTQMRENIKRTLKKKKRKLTYNLGVPGQATAGFATSG